MSTAGRLRPSFPASSTRLSLVCTTTNDAGIPTGNIELHYDVDPVWRRNINPGLHSLELEKFPRCYDRIPERMKERLASRGPGIAVHERLRIGGAMDIARGCTLLDGDVTTTLELPWAVCTQDAVL